MRKIILSTLILSVSSFCYAQTEKNDSIANLNNIEIELNELNELNEFAEPIEIISYTPRQGYFLKSGKTRLTHNFRVGFLFGKDEIMSPDLPKLSGNFEDDVEQKTEQGSSYGLNLSYRITFTPGQMNKDKKSFQVNPLGFGYSFGIDLSGDLQKNYGFSCDILAAAGIEIGTSKIGFGIEALVGAGNVTGFVLELDAANPELSGIYQESFMSFKYGAQVWIKVPSFSNFLIFQDFHKLQYFYILSIFDRNLIVIAKKR